MKRFYNLIDFLAQKNSIYSNEIFGILQMMYIDDLDDFYILLNESIVENKKIKILENKLHCDGLTINSVIIDENNFIS